MDKYNLENFLEFLRDKENKKEEFTTLEAFNAVEGLAIGSIRKYISSKLKGTFLSKGSKRGQWITKGVLEISNDEFLRHMSQSANAKELSAKDKMYYSLVDRSREAFTLAIELYNRPSLKNRVESFAILMVNSWELLIKAEVLKALGYDSVFENNGRSITISQAISKRLQEKDPLTKNLRTLIELRDDATHLLIPELQPQLSRLFQANVLHYQNRYKNQMGNSPISGQSVGMISLIIDGPVAEMAVIKECYGELTHKQVVTFLAKFDALNKECPTNEFAISVDYQLALTNKIGDADLVLSAGENGQQAIVITKPKDLDKTHPYHTAEAIAEINKTHGLLVISTYNFTAITDKHKIKNNKSMYDFTDRPRYSQAFVNWVVKQLKQPDWLEKAVDSRKHKLTKNRKAK